MQYMDRNLDILCTTWTIHWTVAVKHGLFFGLSGLQKMKNEFELGTSICRLSAIQMAKKGKKQANFDEPYLSSRLGLENK